MALGPVDDKNMVTYLLGGESSGHRLDLWLLTTSKPTTCGVEVSARVKARVRARARDRARARARARVRR